MRRDIKKVGNHCCTQSMHGRNWCKTGFKRSGKVSFSLRSGTVRDTCNGKWKIALL